MYLVSSPATFWSGEAILRSPGVISRSVQAVQKSRLSFFWASQFHQPVAALSIYEGTLWCLGEICFENMSLAHWIYRLCTSPGAKEATSSVSILSVFECLYPLLEASRWLWLWFDSGFLRRQSPRSTFLSSVGASRRSVMAIPRKLV